MLARITSSVIVSVLLLGLYPTWAVAQGSKPEVAKAIADSLVEFTLKNQNHVQEAIDGLVALKNNALPALEPLLSHEKVEVRRNVVTVLDEISKKDVAAVPLLVKAMDDTDGTLARKAMQIALTNQPQQADAVKKSVSFLTCERRLKSGAGDRTSARPAWSAAVARTSCRAGQSLAAGKPPRTSINR